MLDFSRRLVLFQYLIKVFGSNFEYIKSEMCRPNYGVEAFGSVDEEGTSVYAKFLMIDPLLSNRLISIEKIREYDENIVRHTIHISEKASVRWLYFQYLCLIFTEYYLDMYFGHREMLKAALNREVAAHNAESSDNIPTYEDGDLNKLAFMCATGSGKTLIMQMNYLQIKYNIGRHHLREQYNKYLLITPNEKLSAQHLREYEGTGITASSFQKYGMTAPDDIAVLEITKLLTEEKYRELRTDSVSVSTKSLYDNNILFVDEGHRGVKSEENTWFSNRKAISQNGFTFEYSATFKQAVAGNKALAPVYAKCILFDYSYKYFYWDGYGKKYAIYNVDMPGNEGNHTFKTYLTGCLLSFYQQKQFYLIHASDMERFHIENPLMVLLGNNVVALKTNRRGNVMEDGTMDEKATLSDVAEFIRFLKSFVTDKAAATSEISAILSNTTELIAEGNEQLFGKTFSYLKSLRHSAEQIYNDILRTVFNTTGGTFKIANIRDATGQIKVQVGDDMPFGLIYVGEDLKLVRYLQKAGIEVDESFFSGDMFDTISTKMSPVNILIGAKKFIEGWNCYRISSMGFLNVGVSEGSQIIQMFGRGVRLHGYENCLKRSSALVPAQETDEHFGLVETLTIFGVRANYIRAFSTMLGKEDVDPPLLIEMPIFYNKPAPKKIKILRVKDNAKYEMTGIRFELGIDESINITTSCYLSAQSIISEGNVMADLGLNTVQLTDLNTFIGLLDWDALYFDMVRYCEQCGYANLMVTKAGIRAILDKSNNWATIYAPEGYAQVSSVSDVLKWQTLVGVLLKKYINALIRIRKGQWEANKLEYVFIEEDDPSKYIQDEKYTFSIDRENKEFAEAIKKLVSTVKEKREMLESRKYENKFSLWSMALQREKPLVYANGVVGIKVSPVSLVESEDAFLSDLQRYLDTKPALLNGKELYLIRNKSKIGIGFFESRYFYPDFILWIINDKKQHIIFIDPKGIGRVGIKDDKVQLSRAIKEKQAELGDDNILLNSVILSYTRYAALPKYDIGKAEWEDSGVLFMIDDKATYVERMVKKVLMHST